MSDYKEIYDDMLSEGGDEWKNTYMDLMSLLLCFFMLLFSFSTMDLKKFKQALGSIQVSLGSNAPPAQLINTDIADGLLANLKSTKVVSVSEKAVINAVEEIFKKEGSWAEDLDVKKQGNRIILGMEDQVFFTGGSNNINKSTLSFLSYIKGLLEKYPGLVLHIKGHTDNRPISNEKYTNNWELSSARAMSVFIQLRSMGVDARRMTATGYADISPLATNDTEIGRRKNRRVEFVLEAKES